MAIYLKHHHPTWGSPYIHAILKERYGESIPSIRMLSHWFSKLHLQDPRESAKHQKIGSSRAVHNIWQVDAKEQITLSDGQKACYLSIVDEKSGAWLGSSVFPLYPYQSSI